jgi:fructokinase
MISASVLADRIISVPSTGRRLIALAGPPASGKSTLAAELVVALGSTSKLVPMDGFHLDNRLLEARGLRYRKGAPETFDLGGLLRLMPSLRSDPQVFFPVFDRKQDIAIAGAGEVDDSAKTVIIEGNYLMFDEPGWRELAEYWDACLFLDVPIKTLKARLIQRWLDHGLSESAARKKTADNDLANARRIVEQRLTLPTELDTAKNPSSFAS